MANRFNIKFTIQAVDKFTTTMKRLERQLNSIQRKADDFDLTMKSDVELNTDEAFDRLAALEERAEALNKQVNRKKKVDIDVGPAKRNVEVLERGLMVIGDNFVAKTKEMGESLRNELVLRDKFEIEADFSPVIREAQRTRRYMGEVYRSQPLMIETTMDVDTAAATSKVSAWRRMMSAMKALTVKVDVDKSSMTRAEARLWVLERLKQRVGRPVVIDILVGDYMKFRRAMDRIATTGRNVGEIVTNTFMGLATTFSTTLIPIIAKMAGDIGSVGVAVGTTAGASMGLVSAFFGAGAAAGGFAAVAIPSLTKVFDKASEISDLEMKIADAKAQGDIEKANELIAEMDRIFKGMNESQLAAHTSLTSFKDTYGALVSSMEPGVMTAFSGALDAISTTLQKATPMISASVDAVNRLMDALNRNLESEDVQAFFEYLNNYGAAALEVISKSMGNFLVGIMNLMAAFAPLSVSMQGGFLAMSEGFRQWTASLAGSEKFREFTDYVKANWPKIKSIFGDAIMGIIALFTAFAPYAADWMSSLQGMMSSFRTFAEGLGQNQQFQAFIGYIRDNAPQVTRMIGDLIEFLVALGVALAPVGAVMVRVASNILEFATNVLQANPELGKLMGWILTLSGGFFTLLPIGIAIVSFFRSFWTIIMTIVPALISFGKYIFGLITSMTKLKGAFTTVRIVMMMLGGPITALIGFLLLLVPVFIHLWQTSESFRTKITEVFNTVKNVVMQAVNAVVTFVMDVWGRLVAFWTENGEMIKQATSNVWNVIVTVITTVMNAIAAVIKFVWPAVLSIITGVWENIKGVISGALDIIMGLVKTFAGLFTGNWSAMWEGIKQVFSGAWEFLINAVQLLLWGRLLKGLAGFAGTFRGGITKLWSGAKTIFTNGVNAVKNFFVNGFNAMKAQGSAIMNAIRNVISNVFNAIVTAVRTRTNNAKTAAVNAFNTMRNSVSSAVSALKSRVTTFFSNILTAVRTKVQSAKSAATNAFNSMKSSVSSIVSNILSTIRSKFESIVNAAKTKMEAAKSAVMTAWNSVMSFLRGIDLFSIGAQIIQGLINGIKSMAGSLVKSAKGVVGDAIEGAKNLLKIKSPSRVFYSMGEYTMMGMENGIVKRGNKVVDAVTNVADKMTRAFNPQLEATASLANSSSYNGYTTAASQYAKANATQAAERRENSRTRVEVPVYLNGREIARASNDEQKRMNQRAEARKRKFSGE